MTVPLKLVYSSAPADAAFCEKLSAHLHTLVQKGVLSEWQEQDILPGAPVAEERHRAWQSADILLLLLSTCGASSPGASHLRWRGV